MHPILPINAARANCGSVPPCEPGRTPDSGDSLAAPAAAGGRVRALLLLALDWFLGWPVWFALFFAVAAYAMWNAVHIAYDLGRQVQLEVSMAQWRTSAYARSLGGLECFGGRK